MAIEVLQTWKDEFENLPKTEDNSWADSVSNYYNDMISNIETNSLSLTDPNFIFNFGVNTFKSLLLSLIPPKTSLEGATILSSAWRAAISNTTVVVNSGAFIGTNSPTTTFSVVSSTIIDPVSITLGKAKLLELSSVVPVDDPQDALFAEKLREATLLLTITAIGLDSQVPPTGPLPLTATMVGLI